MAQVEHVKAHETEIVHVSVKKQMFIFVALVALVLFMMLFSTYPPAHDFFHELRHSLMIIPCH